MIVGSHRHHPAPVSEILIPLIAASVALIAASVALIAVSFLWRRERRRVGGLERELADERAEQSDQDPLAPLKAVLQTATRVREEGLGEVLRGSFDELAGWAEEAEPELRELAARDGTLTILFSDIEDSTALNERLGDRSWLKVLGAHDRIVRASAGEHRGHVVKSQGDGFMIAFAGAEDAVRAAIEIQRQLASGPRRLRRTPIAVRIGVHTGPALEKGGDLFGRNVALAARVADQARGGEILVTAEVSEAAEAEDLVFADPREVELKGLPGSHALVAVSWQDR
jgi:class 3 adenylate cyclase